mmetsp:Transcript_1564/g.2352  ORF Transcript_1564/g.2352 Transcript_1564/m.2352 type:complete len:242 (-) Transcript_1564:590-1315(-)
MNTDCRSCISSWLFVREEETPDTSTVALTSAVIVAGVLEDCFVSLLFFFFFSPLSTISSNEGCRTRVGGISTVSDLSCSPTTCCSSLLRPISSVSSVLLLLVLSPNFGADALSLFPARSAVAGEEHEEAVVEAVVAEVGIILACIRAVGAVVSPFSLGIFVATTSVLFSLDDVGDEIDLHGAVLFIILLTAPMSSFLLSSTSFVRLWGSSVSSTSSWVGWGSGKDTVAAKSSVSTLSGSFL